MEYLYLFKLVFVQGLCSSFFIVFLLHTQPPRLHPRCLILFSFIVLFTIFLLQTRPPLMPAWPQTQTPPSHITLSAHFPIALPPPLHAARARDGIQTML
jgi:hypothetical protein